MDINQVMQTVTTIGVVFGMKVVGAIVVWVVGRYLIGLAVRLVSGSLERQQVDPAVRLSRRDFTPNLGCY